MYLEALLNAGGGQVEEGTWTPSVFEGYVPIPVQMQDYDVLFAYPLNMAQTASMYYLTLGHVEYKTYARKAWASADDWQETWAVADLWASPNGQADMAFRNVSGYTSIKGSIFGSSDRAGQNVGSGEWHYMAVKF